MPLLKTSCGCCALRTGTIIVGVIFLAISLLMLASVTTVTTPSVFVESEGASTAYTVTVIIVRISELIFSALLLYGAIKGKPVLLVPWMVLEVILMIIVIIATFMAAIMFFAAEDTPSGIIYTVSTIISTCIFSYLWLIVYSFYKELREGGNAGIV